MKNSTRKRTSFLCAIAVVLSAVFLMSSGVWAQNEVEPTPRDQDLLGDIQSIPVDPNLSDCSEYYEFGSVEVKLEADKPSYLAGDSLKLSGTVTNKNDFPLTDGNLWIQILRANPDGDSQNGYHLIDQFPAKNNIFLQPKETQNISFEYKISQSFSQDTYYAASFFTVANSYNMAGLAFISNMYADYTPFEVQSLFEKSAYLDRNTVKLNGEQMQFRAFPKSLKAGEDVKIDFKAVNERSKREDFTIKYSLYKWDTLKKENLIKETSENMTLQPGETKNLSYVVPKLAQGTYQLQIGADSPSVKSMIEIRLTSDAVQQGRISFAAIDKFPLNKNEQGSMFTCFNNAGDGGFDGSVDLDLKDGKGGTIEHKSYSGFILSSFSAIKTDFVAKSDFDKLLLTATIKGKDGKVMDQVTTTYDNRSKNGLTGQTAEENGAGKTKSVLWLAGVVIFLAALVALILKYRSKHKYKFGFFLLAVISFSVLSVLSGSKKAEASFYNFRYYYPGSGSIFDVHGNPFLNENCLFKDSSGTCLRSGASIKVGEKITATGIHDGEWVFDIGAIISPPYDSEWYRKDIIYARDGCMPESWHRAVMKKVETSITADSPALVNLGGCGSNCLTGQQPGTVTLKLNPNFFIHHESMFCHHHGDESHAPNTCPAPHTGGAVVQGDTTSAGPSANFKLNIINNCTPNWQCSASVATLDTPACAVGIPPLGTPSCGSCVNHLKLWHDAANCANDCATKCNSAPVVESLGSSAMGVVAGVSIAQSSESAPTLDTSVPETGGVTGVPYTFTAKAVDADVDAYGMPIDDLTYYFQYFQRKDEGRVKIDEETVKDDVNHSYKSGVTVAATPRTFSTAGNYVVEVMVCDNWNCSEWKSLDFTINCGGDPIKRATKDICKGSLPGTCDSSWCGGGTIQCINPKDLGTSFSWTCDNGCEQQSFETNFKEEEPGKCGDANGKTICANQSPSLCSSDLSPIPNDYPNWGSIYDYSWKCPGSCGGSTASCFAKGAKACGWVETNP